MDSMLLKLQSTVQKGGALNTCRSRDLKLNTRNPENYCCYDCIMLIVFELLLVYLNMRAIEP